MAQKKKSGDRTILWWVLWITATIVSFFIASAFWTPFIAERYGSIRETRTAVIWVAAVFGTWLVILLPLIVAMYYKVDKAYEDARLRREKAQLQFRSISIDASERTLPEPVQNKLAEVPPTLEGGHLVNLTLRDGRKVPNVFVGACREILGVYDEKELTFRGADAVDAEPVDMENPPFFIQSKWLRLDGAAPA